MNGLEQVQIPVAAHDKLSKIIYYQNEQLIKAIASFKKWDEAELLNEFLINRKDNLVGGHLIETIEELNEVAPPKRKRGRPPKQKSEDKDDDNKVEEDKNTSKSGEVKKRRGRPPKTQLSKDDNKVEEDKPKKKRGRPKKNNVDCEKSFPNDINLHDVTDEKSDLEKKINSNIIIQKSDEIHLEHEDYSEDENVNDEEEYCEICCKVTEIEGNKYLVDPSTNNVYSFNGENDYIGRLDMDNKINRNVEEL
tara:strand:+ start:18 stop:767 length:750 start_codon:yes stop_codon:yes gene_type:complete